MGDQMYISGLAHSYGVKAHKNNRKCNVIYDDDFYEALLKGETRKEFITKYCTEWKQGWNHRNDNVEAYEKTGG